MIQDYFKGIAAYGRAFRLISKMRLWKYIFIPSILSLLVAGVIFATAWGISDNIGSWLISWYPWEWGRAILESLSEWVGGLLVGALGLVIFKHVILVVVSPFMSPLSQKIEDEMMGKQRAHSGFNAREAVKDIFRGLTVAFRNIIREVFYTLLLMLLGLLIPFVGIFTTVAIFLVQAYYAGFGNMDYTLERHYGVRGSARFVKRNRMLALGNGTVFMGLVLTGIGVLIAPPLATIAATTETVPRLEDYQLLKEQEDREEFV